MLLGEQILTFRRIVTPSSGSSSRRRYSSAKLVYGSWRYPAARVSHPRSSESSKTRLWTPHICQLRNNLTCCPVLVTMSITMCAGRWCSEIQTPPSASHQFITGLRTSPFVLEVMWPHVLFVVRSWNIVNNGKKTSNMISTYVWLSIYGRYIHCRSWPLSQNSWLSVK